jgi:hypothetical protein
VTLNFLITGTSDNRFLNPESAILIPRLPSQNTKKIQVQHKCRLSLQVSSYHTSLWRGHIALFFDIPCHASKEVVLVVVVVVVVVAAAAVVVVAVVVVVVVVVVVITAKNNCTWKVTHNTKVLQSAIEA